MTIYTDHLGKTWKFNDIANAETCPVPIERRTGRLVQIRKGVGAFGSDVYFLRLRDGSLMSFENVWLRPYDGEIPTGPDSPEDEYTIRGEWPETGFIIEKPKQPESEKQSFAMMITESAIHITP